MQICLYIILDRVLQTRKQSRVRRILKDCKERARVSVVVRVRKTLSVIINDM